MNSLPPSMSAAPLPPHNAERRPHDRRAQQAALDRTFGGNDGYRPYVTPPARGRVGVRSSRTSAPPARQPPARPPPFGTPVSRPPAQPVDRRVRGGRAPPASRRPPRSGEPPSSGGALPTSVTGQIIRNVQDAFRATARDMLMSNDDRLGYSAERQANSTQVLYDEITYKIDRKTMAVAQYTIEYQKLRDAMDNDPVSWAAMRSKLGELIRSTQRELVQMKSEQRTIRAMNSQAQTMRAAAKKKHWNDMAEKTMPAADVLEMAAGLEKAAARMRLRNTNAGKVRMAAGIHSEVVQEMNDEEDEQEMEQLEEEEEYAEKAMSLDMFLDDLDQHLDTSGGIEKLPDIPRPAARAPAKRKARTRQ